MTTAEHLRTNALHSPLGMDTAQPELSWWLASEENDVVQTGYAVQVALDDEFVDLVWDTGRVRGAEPFGVRYGGAPLRSRTRYRWRVRVWSTTGDSPERAGDWSAPSWFETAFLDPMAWQASWIGGTPPSSKRDDAVVYLRRTLDLPSEVVRARAYVSALGWYRLFVNGTDLTGHALVPRWTPFDRAVEYQTYDVTDALTNGANVLALAVGDGRYRGALGLLSSRNAYGEQVAALAQIEVELADGTTVTTVTDGDWVAGPGRITGSDPKLGERADLRIPNSDWLTDLTAPARFQRAVVLSELNPPLIAEEVPPVRDVAGLPAALGHAPSGAQIIDFGQNFSGVVRIRLKGPSGRSVQLTHSELLTPSGELDTDYLLIGKTPWYQRDTVILNGDDEWYEPWFTIHGFRYVEVVGLDEDLEPVDVEGLVLTSDIAYTGTFECSDRRLNQLHSNVAWSMRSNFTDTPTDCPTRERSGWTGDIQVFGPTAAVLADVQTYLRRYLRNVALEQHADGSVPHIIPSEQPTTPSLGRRVSSVMASSVGWADAAVLLPWTLYQYYGDRQVLETQYDSMRRWVEHQVRAARKRGRGRVARTLVRGDGRRVEHLIIDSGFHFGEWLRPGEKPLALLARAALRPNAAVTTAYFAHSAGVLARVAEVLGRHDDHQRYRRLAADVRAAWRTVFVADNGRIGRDRQDDYVRALAFDLLLPAQRPRAVDRLVELVEAANGHLDTGFLSTPLLLDVLVKGGRADVATRLLFQTEDPSWLYQVERGATTIWETWEGYHPDGRGKESHNHYALGSAAGWLIEGLVGLSPSEPGWRTISIDPLVLPQLTHASAAVDTPYGPAGVAWQQENGQVELDITVPAGACAQVLSPMGPVSVGSGRHRFSWALA